MDKKKIIGIIRQVTLDSVDRDSSQIHKVCLHYAAAGLSVFRSLGRDGVLQAGEAHWQCSDKKYWGYGVNLEADPPEFHVWIALQDDQVLVDPTTRYWPRQAKEIGGEDWKSRFTPPDFLWSDGHARARYFPTEEATMAAFNMVPKAAWAEMLQNAEQRLRKVGLL